MSLQYFNKKCLFIAISFYLFIAILCAKILCVNKAFENRNLLTEMCLKFMMNVLKCFFSCYSRNQLISRQPFYGWSRRALQMKLGELEVILSKFIIITYCIHILVQLKQTQIKALKISFFKYLTYHNQLCGQQRSQGGCNGVFAQPKLLST